MKHQSERDVAIKTIHGTAVLALLLGIVFLFFSLITFTSAIVSLFSEPHPELNGATVPGPAYLFLQGLFVMLVGIAGIAGFRKRYKKKGKVLLFLFGGFLGLFILFFPAILELPVFFILLFLLLAGAGLWILLALNYKPVRLFYKDTED